MGHDAYVTVRFPSADDGRREGLLLCGGQMSVCGDMVKREVLLILCVDLQYRVVEHVSLCPLGRRLVVRLPTMQQQAFYHLALSKHALHL